MVCFFIIFKFFFFIFFFSKRVGQVKIMLMTTAHQTGQEKIVIGGQLPLQVYLNVIFVLRGCIGYVGYLNDFTYDISSQYIILYGHMMNL